MSASGGGALGGVWSAISSIRDRVASLSLSDFVGKKQAAILTGFAGGIASLKNSTEAVNNLIAFGSNPLEFMLGLLLEYLVGLILEGAGVVVGAVNAAGRVLSGIPGMLYSPVLSAGSAIADPVVGIAEMLNGVLVSLSTAAGPASPILVFLLWVVLAIALTWLVNVGLKAVKWIT